MSATLTKPSLQDIILDAIGDAIAYRKEEPAFCGGCRNSPVDHCLDHERDYALARDYEEAERRIRAAADDADVLALLNGKGGTS